MRFIHLCSFVHIIILSLISISQRNVWNKGEEILVVVVRIYRIILTSSLKEKYYFHWRMWLIFMIWYYGSKNAAFWSKYSYLILDRHVEYHLLFSIWLFSMDKMIYRCIRDAWFFDILQIFRLIILHSLHSLYLNVLWIHIMLKLKVNSIQ